MKSEDGPPALKSTTSSPASGFFSLVTLNSSLFLLPLFFLSGISALLYQVVWLKYLGFVFGNTVQAAATLIAIYLGGLGVGAYLFSRFFREKNPLLLYAVVEGLIGMLGAFSPNAFALLDDAYVASYQAFTGSPGMLVVARIFFAAICLLPPTLLMGGTLPLLVRAFTASGPSAHAVSALYAANTFGATAGVALAGFLLIPSIGLIATIAVGVAINFLLAISSVALASSARKTLSTVEHDPPQDPAVLPSVGAPLILAGSLVMGLTAIADEVFWSRILVLHLGSSVYAYSLMLFSFLIGLAIGSAAVDRFMARVSATRALGWIELALSIALALQIHFFVHFSDVLVFFATIFGSGSYTATLFTFLAAVSCALLIPTTLMGATFPLTVKLYSEVTKRAASSAVGIVYFFNTVGSILGSVAAGFLLIRLVGSQNGLLLTALLNLLLGAAFLLRSRLSSDRKWIAAAGVIVTICFLMAKPNGVILSAGLFVDEKAEVLLFREDVTATVTLRRFGPEALSLELNGVNVAGTSSNLIGTQKLQGHLPLLMHPDPKRVLHIGFGSGGTAYAVSRHDVSNITIAEISPEVLETSHRYLGQVNHGVLSDPRVRTEINDGRNFVLATPEKFDVILSDSIHPRYAGNGSLYTRDYFELCRARLTPDGMVSMWLPTYSLTPRNYLMIVRAFRDVFPNTTIWYVPNSPNGFTIVIGRLEQGPIPFDRLARASTPAVAEELRGIGIADTYDLTSALLLDPMAVKWITERVEPHVDDLPAVEYESGRIVDRDGTWLVNFDMLTRTMSPLARAFSGVPDAGRIEQQQHVRDQRGREHLAFLRKHLGMPPVR